MCQWAGSGSTPVYQEPAPVQQTPSSLDWIATTTATCWPSTETEVRYTLRTELMSGQSYDRTVFLEGRSPQCSEGESDSVRDCSWDATMAYNSEISPYPGEQLVFGGELLGYTAEAGYGCPPENYDSEPVPYTGELVSHPAEPIGYRAETTVYSADCRPLAGPFAEAASVLPSDGQYLEQIDMSQPGDIFALEAPLLKPEDVAPLQTEWDTSCSAVPLSFLPPCNVTSVNDVTPVCDAMQPVSVTVGGSSQTGQESLFSPMDPHLLTGW